jgi:acyl-CoA thioesterase
VMNLKTENHSMQFYKTFRFGNWQYFTYWLLQIFDDKEITIEVPVKSWL